MFHHGSKTIFVLCERNVLLDIVGVIGIIGTKENSDGHSVLSNLLGNKLWKEVSAPPYIVARETTVDYVTFSDKQKCVYHKTSGKFCQH